MGVTGINHVGITVSDLDASIVFWRDVVGLELAGSGEVAYPHLDEIIGLGPTRLRWAELLIPGQGLLELFQYLQPLGSSRAGQRTADPGTVHLCLECDDLESLLSRIRGSGYPSRTPAAVRIPFGDWQDWLSVYVSSPDGVTLELVQRPAGAPPGVPGSAAGREALP
ncbi:MAG: VOC family protein [Actinomycetota bacterium]